VPQHMLVAADFHFWVTIQWSKCVKLAKTKWWMLKEVSTQSFEQKALNEGP
jgi:hypothetical protein